jgi:MoaA/NifB/PqqE/SkfB family radical SAM enzyme
LHKQKLRIYSGCQTLPIRLKFWRSLGRLILKRNKYPLFFLNPAKGGFIKTIRMKQTTKLQKITKFHDRYYFTLRLPHWPSKPFDNMVANGGLNFAAAGSQWKPQIDYVILAITRKCNYNCKHCYERFNIAEQDSVPVERWKEVVAEIQRIGVSVINLSGGEPMLRYDGLMELLQTGDKDRSDFHLHTSGHKVTRERALELRKAGLDAAAIGLDDVNPERHDSLRGYPDSFKEATQAIRYFQDADVFTYTNMCVTKDLIHSGDLWNYFEYAKGLNVGAIQLLEPRPCGGYFSEEPDDLISEDEREIVTRFFIEGNRKKRFKDYPAIYYISYIEAPERFGCMMAGLSHFHIDSRGNVEPCVFLPVSFGNIMEEDFLVIYERMRKAVPFPLHKRCPSIYLAEKIKAKKNAGIDLPVPFRELEKEWQKMFDYI